MKNISVEKAINRGYLILKFPFYFIMFVFFGLIIFLEINEKITLWSRIFFYLSAFIIPFIWWAFMITKWRIWALENVRNVHELKKRAEQEKLIPYENSFIEKFVIKSKNDKLKLEILNEKFEMSDIFQDNLNIEKETAIYFSIWKNLFLTLISFSCIFFGVIIFINADSILSYLFSLLFISGIYFGYEDLMKILNRKPTLIINDNGIKIISSEFYKWNDIKNEEVLNLGGKNILFFKHPKGVIELQIDDFNISRKSLNQLLLVYKSRFLKKTNR
jgi:hypothetical protein